MFGELTHLTDILYEKPLGKGGYGEVYRACYKGLPCAVKRALADAPAQSMRAEAEISYEISNHYGDAPAPSHLVHTQAYFTNEFQQMMIVYELALGSLTQLMQNNPSLVERESDAIIYGILTGMQQLHAQGIIHRDIAARNVLLIRGTEGSIIAKLADFGRSLRLPTHGATGRLLPSIDRPDETEGPVRWMSPGEHKYRRSSIYSDLWSTGVTFFQLGVMGSELPYAKLPLIADVVKYLKQDDFQPPYADSRAHPKLRALQETLYIACRHGEREYEWCDDAFSDRSVVAEILQLDDDERVLDHLMAMGGHELLQRCRVAYGKGAIRNEEITYGDATLQLPVDTEEGILGYALNEPEGDVIVESAEDEAHSVVISSVPALSMPNSNQFVSIDYGDEEASDDTLDQILGGCSQSDGRRIFGMFDSHAMRANAETSERKSNAYSEQSKRLP